MSKLPLRLRLSITAWAILLAFAAGMLVMGGVISEQLTQSAARSLLERSWPGMLAKTREALQGGGLASLDRFYKDQWRIFGLHGRLVDRDGRILADGESEKGSWVAETPDRSTRRALGGERITLQSQHPSTSRPILVRVEPLGESGAAMRLAIPMDPLFETARDWFTLASGITLLLLALSSLAIYFMFRHALSPLSDLTRAMRRLSEGEHAVHLEPGPFLESDQLSRSFDRVGSRFRDLERLWIGEKERLRAILTLSQEAVLLVAQNGQVLFINDPFRKTFQATLRDGDSRPYWELLRSTPLSALLERRLAQPVHPGEEPQALEWEHGGRHFRGRLCPLPEQGAFLVTVSDVTDEMQMSQAKRDLVANVSHELNTPLTSMKGFLETLTDGERDGERLRLLGIVKRNTDRLIAIVKDLLLLSNLDRGPQSLQLETVHPLEILRAVADLYRPSLADKGMELRLDLPAELPALRADPFKLEQVFVNLLDNALKYTDRGQVGLEARHEAGRIEITIWDTGIGINPGLEEKIFERFFTVDKSRSRKAGGTGLGLSIVKHIVLLHGGSITVTRRIEGGTAFRVSLPVS